MPSYAASRRRRRSLRAAPVRTTVRLPDDRQITARVWAGEGTPLVLLHGVLDSSEGWSSFCRLTSRPCLAIDLSGFGDSDLPQRPSFAGYAEDVVAAIEQLVDDEFILVGHSFGGAIATAVAEQLGERVRALVLLAPAGFGRIALAELISIPGVRTAAERLMPLTLTNRATVAAVYRAMIGNGNDPAEDVIDRVLDRGGALVPGAVAATKAVVRGGTSRNAFYRRHVAYDGPVIAVWGDRDRVVPSSHARGLTRALPQAELRIWPGMGHHPQAERPRELAALAEEICGRVERRAQQVAA
jgi:pimeloyl-ACP methyl ester carboxylesterase